MGPPGNQSPSLGTRFRSRAPRLRDTWSWGPGRAWSKWQQRVLGSPQPLAEPHLPHLTLVGGALWGQHPRCGEGEGPGGATGSPPGEPMGVEPGLSVQPEAGALSPPPPSGPCRLPRAEEGGAVGAEPAASFSCQVQPCRVQLIWVSAGASSTSFLPRPEPPGESHVPLGPQDKTSIRPSCPGLPTLAWATEPQMYAGGMARGPPFLLTTAPCPVEPGTRPV